MNTDLMTEDLKKKRSSDSRSGSLVSLTLSLLETDAARTASKLRSTASTIMT